MAAPIAAQSGQYTACIDAADRLLTARPPETPSFGSTEADLQILVWVRFLKVGAELGLTAISEDPRLRWQSWRRTWEEQGPELRQNALAQPYFHLLSGLSTHLSSDALVNEETISSLEHAGQRLSLHRHAGFLQDAIGKLTWRRNVLADFWRSLSIHDLRQARHIYHEELLPAFGSRMPSAIRLGMVIVDWDAGAAPTLTLLQQLEVLRFEAPDLVAELVDKTRDYIHEGESLRQLVRFLKEQRFEELISQIDSLQWVGLLPGETPLVAAVAKLYACVKMNRTDEAVSMGSQLSEAGRFDRWVADEGALLLGYVLFSQRKYPDAAGVFERINVSSLLGHDVDKYWAACQFNYGLQLLKVDQNEKAFAALGMSLEKATGSHASGELAPLCVHFALKGFEARNGEQARQSFVLLAKSLESAPESDERDYRSRLAHMGELLCRALMEEDVRELQGERFLELLPGEDASPGDLTAPAKGWPNLKRSARILAVCQELRRQLRLPASEMMRRQQIADFLLRQCRPLEELQEVLKRTDPLLLVLRGLVHLLITKEGRNEALRNLEQAVRLGVDSKKLGTLLKEHLDLAKNARDANKVALDLFDIYLADGAIPIALRNRLVRNDDLMEVYLLARNYRPADIVTDEVQTGTRMLCERVERLLQSTYSDGTPQDQEVEGLRAEAGELVSSLRNAEKRLNNIEESLMERLAGRLRSQNVAMNAAPDIKTAKGEKQ